MAERRLLLASANRHKLEELRRILSGWTIEALDRDDFPPETGSTYGENARVKAAFGRIHAGPGWWAMGEDSGIEAEALGGRPGVESARWAEDGVARLLDELAGHAERAGRYVCAMVWLGPDGEDVAVEGTLPGRIEGPPRGTGGFGYDPIFVPEGETMTVAELGDAWKEKHSHRARAAALAVAAVRELSAGG